MFSSRVKTAIPRLVRLKSSHIQPQSNVGVPAASPMPSLSKPPVVPAPAQAPNYPDTWSTMQRKRPSEASSPLFEQIDMTLQPMPLSAMQLVSEDPIRVVHARKAVCDGGGGPLGHPKIWINLDKPGPKSCGYCGIRFEQAPHHGHDSH
ncbi:SubName: Full=Related to NADH2 dehydrogenase (Ubiquinone) complex I 13K-A chain {ECO:0000313/EMBL:CCA77917.1} [Serendipita indica DSM 11827]|uniref:Related to NADH2 dehydrogenase (Ubiquinone) complex I 13K-A chain n=1 Tax=Serendipita indica (strain DSM 11827) TaxID=1109443 RepID=G4U2V8_SERID|nr:SubName: Full=Related to NADH2 dehydrogenase (Ubiquinone) complex I 13K-A chain {ECO:0000313/EMBL:CCA77917.1} [Serendipita indica DSM 11827]CCA77917.1 related to NADH2 dehydrogenase (ubiquinone) complex I 13K-A chain precursor [Serendipita indica DSM 11827]